MRRSIRVSQRVSRSRREIWRALTEPSCIAGWQADAAAGEVELGGHLVLRWPALGAEIDLDVLDVQPEHRLTVATGGSEVTFTLGPDRIEVVQTGVDDEDEAEGTHAAWQITLATLAHYLEHHFELPRHTSWSVVRARTSAAAAHVFFTDPQALRAWLTTSGEVGSSGTAASLELSWGERLTGQVLASVPDRDVAISWSERGQSVLVMRTLPAPFSDDERLVVGCWSLWGAPPDPGAAQHLDHAFSRLKQVLGRAVDA